MVLFNPQSIAYLLTDKTKSLSELLTDKNNFNWSQVPSKAQSVLPQGTESKVRSSYRNCSRFGLVLARSPTIAHSASIVLAARIPTVARFQHSSPQGLRVRGASIWAVPAAGAQLPVPVPMLLGVRVRFRFEARDWETQQPALLAPASGMLKVSVPALGREFPGLGMEKVGR